MRKLMIAICIAVALGGCVYSPNVFVNSDVTLNVSK